VDTELKISRSPKQCQKEFFWELCGQKIPSTVKALCRRTAELKIGDRKWKIL
jgi:hypothetical protein